MGKISLIILIVGMVMIVQHFRKIDSKLCYTYNGKMEYNFFTGDICHLGQR